MTAHRWRLHVDESGDLGNLRRDAVVAGILISDTVPELDEDALRHALEQAAPGHPWPVHAHLFFRPSMVALAAERSGEVAGGIRVIPWVLALFETHAPDALARARAAIAADREPRWDDLTALDSLLAREQPEWSMRLSGAARQVGIRIEQLVIHALEAANARSLVPPVAMAFAAGEAERGDAARHGDRYLTLLEVLLERVGHALGGHAGAHEVHLHVLGRDVPEPILATNVPLHVRHLGALRSELIDSLPANVRFVLEPVASYHGDDVPVGHALADLLALRARRALQDGSLARAEARLEHLGAVARSGMPPRSHVASSGVPRERLRALREGRQPPALPPGTRVWAAEQVADWETP